MIDARELKGMEIAAICRIDRQPDGSFKVPSQSGLGRYTVNIDGETPRCTCPDYESRGGKCKHIYAVQFAIKREDNGDGTETITKTLTVTEKVRRPTYKQDWPAYNTAQTTEKHEFQRLLADLCGGITNPPAPRTGRRPIPLSDIVFAAAFKVYSTVSCRRFMCDLKDAHGRGYVSRVPCYNSIFNYLEDETLAPILTSLIVESSKPLAAIETDFAPDSSGFSTSRFIKWFDHKYGVLRQDHDWVKVHMMCGVKTNIVTAVEIHDKHAQDAPLLPAMLDTTARNFAVKEVAADKGYNSVDNHNAIDKAGATPFIAFKSSHTGAAGGVFGKMFHYFSFNRDEFLDHYHKRSNAESTFSMMKAKFGDAVRSRTPIAMKNEALCKVLCHNICCLIQSIQELGIEAMFWQPAADVLPA